MSGSLLPSDWSKLSLERVAALCPVQLLKHPAFERADIEVVIKREDLLHPAFGGNKFYKLFHCLHRARTCGFKGVISFGGAYSNHLYALAFAGKELGLKTVGIIRGERPPTLSATLQDIKEAGMELHFIPRKDYRSKMFNMLSGANFLKSGYYTIPEGGDSDLGSRGCQIWADVAVTMCPWKPTHICLAGGTGGTLAGVVAASVGIEVHGFLALKGANDEKITWRRTVLDRAEAISGNGAAVAEILHIQDQYHFGGYGKYPAELAEFMASFERTTGIPLDPIYTAKMLWGVVCMAKTGQWPSGSRLLLLHTGGLQGRRGFNIDWNDSGWSRLLGAST